MKIIKKELSPDYGAFGLPVPGKKAVLTCMVHDTQPERSFGGMLVIPGGSYEKCSKREGEPCAVRFYSHGFNAFVLEYSVVKKPFPTALLELCEAVRFIRENRAELCMTDFLCVTGFSAGGHLAASLGAYHDSDVVGAYRGKVTPDRLILCYPVITSGEYTHSLSAANIAPDEETKELISIEKHIGKGFPPSFIWHCADDRTVPVMNSLLLAEELSGQGIPYEMHIFPKGGHALAMCDTTTVRDEDYERFVVPHNARWAELALEWLEMAQAEK